MKRPQRRLGASGAVLVELLIAYIPVLFCFLAFWQLSELLVAQMVVARASSAAGRAAVVVLPDDPMFYAGEAPNTLGGKREADVRLAAGMILAASPHLAEDFDLYIGNLPEDVGAVEISVAANFRCDRLRFVCGGGGVVKLSATSQHTYHGAKYQYEPTDLSAATGDSFALGDSSCQDGDPASNGSGGKGAGSSDDDGCPPGQSRQPSGRCEATRGGGKDGLCKDKTPPRRNGQCSDGTCQNTGKKPNKNRPDYDPNNPCPDPTKPSDSGSGSGGTAAGGSSAAGGVGGSGGTAVGGSGGTGSVGGGGGGGGGGRAGNGGAGGSSNLPDCSRVERKRAQVQASIQRKMRERWDQIQAMFPPGPKPLYIGYRGSLARGRKHPGKGSACWDPETSDVDFFIVFETEYRLSPKQYGALKRLAGDITRQSGIGTKGSEDSKFYGKTAERVDWENKPADPQYRYPPQ